MCIIQIGEGIELVDGECSVLPREMLTHILWAFHRGI